MSQPPRSLSEELRGWSDEAVADFLRARPDLLAPVPPDFGALAARASYPGSVARALDGLTLAELQVAQVLCLLPSPTTAADVSRLLGGAFPTEALDTLRRLAVLWGPDDALQLIGVVRQLLPDPAGLGQPAGELLRLRPAAMLTVLADNLLGGEAGPAPDKATLIAMLTAVYADEARLDAVLAELTPAARGVLDRLTPGPPLGQIEDAARAVPLSAVRTPVDEVLARGLVLAVDASTVVLPREVGLRLRAGVAFAEHSDRCPEPAVRRLAIRDIDRAAAGSAFGIVHQVEQLLEAWGLDGPVVLRGGGLGVRELRRIASDLEVDEHGAALAMETAAAAGLLAESDNGRLVPTEAYDGWRGQDTAYRWAALAWAWFGSGRLAALAGTRDREKLLAALSPDLEYPQAATARRAVLSELLALNPGEGWAPVDLADRLEWRSPLRYGRLGRELFALTLHEAEVLGLAASGALSSAGRALLDGETAAREKAGSTPSLPPAAQAATAKAAAASALSPLLAKPLDYVLVQADLTAVAPGPLTSDLSAALAIAADVESRGGATVYRFTEASVRRALDAGRSAADLHAWLTKISKTPVPQPLTYLVDDVARRHGRMRVGAAASYVRADDESLLAEILADRRAADLGLRQLAPTVLVSPLPPERLLEALRELGAVPVLEGKRGEVVLRRADVHRAPAPPTLPQPVVDPPPPGDVLLATAVRALRAGDRARASVRPTTFTRTRKEPESDDAGAPPVELLRRSPADTLALLREAVRDGSAVWIGYVNAEGGASVRLIEPVQVSGGFVSAYDHLRDESRTFSVHRITGVTPAEESAG